jgi:LCP family protein required for cell wall assembly
MAKRFLLGALGIALLCGAATAVLALGEVHKLVNALGQSRAVKIAPKVLAPTSGGAPQTLLLVGNDQRPLTRYYHHAVLPHSNEMLLVRIDPGKPTISMLSIPRELQVPIYPPGVAPVVDRINSAYTLGGIQLMTETIKRVLGVSINHVFVVTFPKFKRAVNEMGCVYMTVDRRYHHVNEPGGEQYFEINLQPGYQRLCGQQALEFVANRHEDTSLVRDARDQRFLLEVKAQYGATLFESRERFERILGKAVETDLHGAGQVLDLLRTLVQSQGKPVRQVPFQVNLLPTYDTATPQQIHESVRSFLNGTASIPKHRLGAVVRAAPHVHHGKAPGVALTPTPSSALAKARLDAPTLPFALEYPRARESYAGEAADTLRRYDVRDPQGRLHPAYVIAIDRGPLGEFYDVQGIDWSDPPLLSNPSQTVHIGSRTYGLFYVGEQIRTIAWREGNAAYWIQNTLTNSVPPRAMLAMAEDTLPVIHVAGAGATATVQSVRGFNLPPRATPATSLLAKLGAVLGFVSLAIILVLALRVFARRRELNVLREQVARAMASEARLRPILATVGIPRSEQALAKGSERAAPAPTLTVHHARGSRRGVLAGFGIGVLAILVAVAVYALRSGSSSTPSGFPTPVAVFNATSSPGVAHRIAGTLTAGRVHIAQVGDTNASLAAGVYVLYPPGARTEARRVASLIQSLSPTVTPIQPQVQSVVGRQDEIVIVVD